MVRFFENYRADLVGQEYAGANVQALRLWAAGDRVACKLVTYCSRAMLMVLAGDALGGGALGRRLERTS